MARVERGAAPATSCDVDVRVVDRRGAAASSETARDLVARGAPVVNRARAASASDGVRAAALLRGDSVLDRDARRRSEPHEESGPALDLDGSGRRRRSSHSRARQRLEALDLCVSRCPRADLGQGVRRVRAEQPRGRGVGRLDGALIRRAARGRSSCSRARSSSGSRRRPRRARRCATASSSTRRPATGRVGDRTDRHRPCALRTRARPTRTSLIFHSRSCGASRAAASPSGGTRLLAGPAPTRAPPLQSLQRRRQVRGPASQARAEQTRARDARFVQAGAHKPPRRRRVRLRRSASAPEEAAQLARRRVVRPARRRERARARGKARSPRGPRRRLEATSSL